MSKVLYYSIKINYYSMIPKKDYVIPREREMDMVPEIWNSISETDDITKKWHGIKVPSIDNFFINRKCFCIYKTKDWDKIAKFIMNRFLREPNYFRKIWRLHNKFGHEAETFARKTLKYYTKFDASEELKALKYLKNQWIHLDQVNVLPWFIGAETLREYIQSKFLAKYKLSMGEAEVLWASNTLSLVAQEEVALYQAAIDYQNKRNIKPLATQLSLNFGWMPFGYDGPNFWDEGYYRRRILKLGKLTPAYLKDKLVIIKKQITDTKHNQNNIIAKYRIRKDLVRLLDIQQKLYIMTDERKRIQFQIHHAYHEVLKKFGNRYDLTLHELKYLETEELVDMVKKKTFKQYQTIAQGRLKYPIYLYTSNGKIRLIEYSKDTAIKLNKFVLQNNDNSVFYGLVANVVSNYPIKGKVRRILNSREVGKMKKGEILVTSMTTPDFVQAMRLAKAIITDEGGITSHAAIVSRELGVTCIIGTKIATQVLKDGDLIEIDANKGIIRKLK